MKLLFDEQINSLANGYLEKLEVFFESDVIFFYGPIYPGVENSFRLFIEDLKTQTNRQNINRLTILINTPGGVAEIVEKLVDIIRFHYKEVYFVVPDFAMSAGTIFCMSGNNTVRHTFCFDRAVFYKLFNLLYKSYYSSFMTSAR